MKRTIEALKTAPSTSESTRTVYRAVCRDVAEETHANRVSIWKIEDDNTCIRCECFYDANRDEFTEGQTLRAKDFPRYFNPILAGRSVVAPDARSHSATAELSDPYFREHNIYSLLDYVIHDDYQPTGIICCDNAGELRAWRDRDVAYLSKMSTLISFNFKAR